MDNKEYLMHYGVLGMRWGIRRSKSSLNIETGKYKKQKNWSDDAKEASRIKNKNVKSMSNAELKKLNERTRLEQEYKRLNPTKIKKGIAFVTASAALMGTVLNVYNNSDKIIQTGKKVCDKIIDGAGDMIMKDLAKGFSNWSV